MCLFSLYSPDTSDGQVLLLMYFSPFSYLLSLHQWYNLFVQVILVSSYKVPDLVLVDWAIAMNKKRSLPPWNLQERQIIRNLSVSNKLCIILEGVNAMKKEKG